MQESLGCILSCGPRSRRSHSQTSIKILPLLTSRRLHTTSSSRSSSQRHHFIDSIFSTLPVLLERHSLDSGVITTIALLYHTYLYTRHWLCLEWQARSPTGTPFETPSLLQQAEEDTNDRLVTRHSLEHHHLHHQAFLKTTNEYTYLIHPRLRANSTNTRP